MVTRDGNVPLFLNRLTSDGIIAEFRKDNATVGSIKIQGTAFTLDHGVAQYINIADELDYFPSSFTGQRRLAPTVDNVTNLGASDRRFKDLYLSGTVHVGDWTITESNGSLYFATGGVNKMKLDASGNLQVVGSVEANATIS